MKKIIINKILPMLIIVVGVIIAAYPWISDYIYKSRVSDVIAEYDKTVRDTSDDEIKKIIKEAKKYNDNLTKETKVLHDPFTGEALNLMSKKYASQLSINGNDAIGYITIPKIDVRLPIYHGTSQTVLQSGIGHLEGTSLPIGGKGTHSVLTGHTGLSDKKLFTDLVQMEKGDLFFINTLGKKLCYKVNKIKVVLPNDIRTLVIKKNEDLCTLVTCTPYGVNDHRLLVTGKRTRYDESLESSQKRNKKLSNWRLEYLICIFIGLLIAIILIVIGKYIRKKECEKQ